MKVYFDYFNQRFSLKHIATYTLITLLSCYSWGQSATNIDSLKRRLEKTTVTEERIEVLLSIIDAYSGIDDNKAIQYARTALIEADNADNEEVKANLHFILGSLYEEGGNYDQAIDNYLTSLDIYRDLSIEKEVANLYYSLGDIYKKKGLYRLSLENCLEGLKIYERLNDSAGLSDIYICMGSLYKYQNNNARALDYYNKSLNLRTGINDFEGMAVAYNNIGVVYSLEGNEDLALDYFNRSLNMFIEAGDIKNEGITLGNIAGIYLTQQKYDEALESITRSLKIHTEIGYSRGQAIQYQSLGRYYNLTGNSDLAIENMVKSFELFSILGRLEDEKEVTASLSEVYYNKGDFKNAFDYFSLYKDISDRIFNLEMMKSITLMEYEYNQSKETEIHSLKDQKRKIINTSILFALAFTIIIVALLFSQLKISNRHHSLKFKNIELEKRQIETDLELKQKELTASTIYMVRTSEIINSIVERFESAKKNLKEENIPVISNIIDDLKSSANINIWEDFEIRFLQVYKAFYENLQEKFPDLTTNEKRISAFIRLDMSTKEISSITTQSPHSINIARTRLRKKLGLANKDINLSSFLSQF
ncbi:MAG TPA: tetratricopeptide repeat protein [Bacteroidales bacterium]|nr:tetratricopeptide repeat protein [Bacteroidales bacterium]